MIINGRYYALRLCFYEWILISISAQVWAVYDQPFSRMGLFNLLMGLVSSSAALWCYYKECRAGLR